MNTKMKYITKSDILRGIQCLKQAYMHRFHKDLATPLDPYSQMIIDRGNIFGEYAQKEFDPKTSRLAFIQGDSIEEGLRKTQEALNDESINTIFEASFVFNDIFVRCDILNKNLKTKKWELYEVKSGSELDDQYILDTAVQQWLLEKINFPLQDSYIWYVNKKCQLPDLTHLFSKEKLTDRTSVYYFQIEQIINDLRKVFAQKKSPEQEIGTHCSKPFDCPFKAHCHKLKKVPEFSVFNVPRLGKRAFEYYEQGKVNIEDLDSKEGFTVAQARMIDCTQSNTMYLNKEAIKESLSNWKFPLYMLDFEAMEYDLPGFVGTTPGIHVAFQVSIHRLDSVDAPLVKIGDYLHSDNSDPRLGLAEFLSQNIKEEGSIVAYSQAYEKGKLKAMAEFHPNKEEVSKALEKMMTRLVDPLPIFRDAVYHPDFKGSYSIKKVAPALLGEASSYEHLSVKDGTEAIMAYRKYISNTLSLEDKEQIKTALIQYCDKDTFVMGELVRWLYKNS